MVRYEVRWYPPEFLHCQLISARRRKGILSFFRATIYSMETSSPLCYWLIPQISKMELYFFTLSFKILIHTVNITIPQRTGFQSTCRFTVTGMPCAVLQPPKRYVSPTTRPVKDVYNQPENSGRLTWHLDSETLQTRKSLSLNAHFVNENYYSVLLNK